VCAISLLCAAQDPEPPAATPQTPPPAQNQPAGQTPAQPAQDQNSTKTAPGNTSPDKSEADKNKTGQDANAPDKTSGKSNDRLLFAMPNFLTVANGSHVEPLKPKQKFVLVARGAFDYFQIPWYAAIAAIGQAENTEPAYGQGMEGYGKRFATSFADGAIENFMTGAVFASVFHQDPRFFQSGEGGFGHRTGYAVSRIFVTRSDSGKAQFNVSEIFGSATAAAVSTYSYHPRSKLVNTPTGVRFIPSDRTLSNTASVWATQIGYDTLTLLMREFWPDLQRKIAHKRGRAPEQQTTKP
jgi:hypothetical protein